MTSGDGGGRTPTTAPSRDTTTRHQPLRMTSAWCHDDVMDLTPYLDGLRRDLAAAAGAGSEESRAVAERLALALEPSARLALMEAISQAASEITSELPEGTVDVRLAGRELDFVVHVDAPAAAAPPPPPPPAPEPDEEEGQARVSLRLPESLKARPRSWPPRPGRASTPGSSRRCARRPAAAPSRSTST